jgi:uncharacterized protein YecT (DUF1311 family)
MLVLSAAVFFTANCAAQSASAEQSGSQPPQAAQPAESQSQPPQSEPPVPNTAQDLGQNTAQNYDRSIFQKPISAEQLAFLSRFAGASSNDLIRDRQYRKLMKAVIPDCIFHYGWDMMLADAMEKVLAGSKIPVQIRDGRYLMASGRSGPYLGGRGFLWIDLHDGVALGGVYFHPTNGEPTPTVTIFSRQVREQSLRLRQLPPAFAEDLSQWAADANVPAVTTRYFITGSNRKILLEHDEDYCAQLRATTGPTDECEKRNADAADIDMNAAYYLDQTHNATNGTAWMIVGADQKSWLQLRDNTCDGRADRLRCWIRMTRDRTMVIMNLQH